MNKVFFIAEVQNVPAYLVEATIEDIEKQGCVWEWTKQGNIRYWYK